MYKLFKKYGLKQPGETYENYLDRYKTYVNALLLFELLIMSSPFGGFLTLDTGDFEDICLETG